MAQYVFTMTSRMIAIAVSCLLLLFILLFLMGVEIGKQMGQQPSASVAPQVSSRTAVPALATGSAPSPVP